MNEYLNPPATITIIREKRFVDCAMPVEYMCNGVVVCRLKNGQCTTITTHETDNYIGARKPKGFLETRNIEGGDPVLVKCSSGKHVEIHFVSGDFDRVHYLD